MTIQLPELPFRLGALEPWMSTETLQFHYGKHHRGYVDKLNALIKGTPFENMELEEIVVSSDGAIFNNAAQAWNHSFFWQSLTPQSVEPQGEFLRSLEQSFGSLESFREEFKKAATEVFGSGYIWLIKDGPRLVIETSRNADTPIKQRRIPILTCDLWEHAYYIDHRNERPNFVDNFFKIINWKFAETNFLTSSIRRAA